MTFSMTLQMVTTFVKCQMLEQYITKKVETAMNMMLYTMSPTEVCSKREPISPVTEYGASPKHFTKNRIGLKTVKVSEPASPVTEYGASPKHLTKNRNGLKTVKVLAETVVILLHEKPGPF